MHDNHPRNLHSVFVSCSINYLFEDLPYCGQLFLLLCQLHATQSGSGSASANAKKHCFASCNLHGFCMHAVKHRPVVARPSVFARSRASLPSMSRPCKTLLADFAHLGSDQRLSRALRLLSACAAFSPQTARCCKPVCCATAAIRSCSLRAAYLHCVTGAGSYIRSIFFCARTENMTKFSFACASAVTISDRHPAGRISSWSQLVSAVCNLAAKLILHSGTAALGFKTLSTATTDQIDAQLGSRCLFLG